jgi:hypothetical protein
MQGLEKLRTSERNSVSRFRNFIRARAFYLITFYYEGLVTLSTRDSIRGARTNIM